MSTNENLTTEPRDTYNVGDLVVPDPAAFTGGLLPGVHRIIDVPRGARGVNYKTRPVSGVGGGVRGPARVLLAFTGTEEQAEDYRPSPAPLGPMCPVVGTLVEVHGHSGIEDGTFYVVMGPSSKALDAAKLVKLHGDGDRYWPSVYTSNFTVVDPSRVTIAPEAGA